MMSDLEKLLNRSRDLYRDMVILLNDPMLITHHEASTLLTHRLQAAMSELDQAIWRLEHIIEYPSTRHFRPPAV